MDKITLRRAMFWLTPIYLIILASALRDPALAVVYSVILVGMVAASWSQRILSIFDRPALRWVGARSYSVYLLHFGVGALLLSRFSPSWGTLVLLLATVGIAMLILLLAHIVYVGIERPSQHMARLILGKSWQLKKSPVNF